MKKIRFDHNRILYRITIPMSIIMFVQMVLIFITIIFGATFSIVNVRTVETFQSKVNLEGNYIETNMIQNWGNIRSDQNNISTKISDFLIQKHYSTESLKANNDISVEALSNITDEMYLLLRKNSVTDVFFIINNNSNEKNGIYLRDRNPNANSADNGDILIEVAPLAVKSIFQTQGYDSSTNYESRFHFNNLDNTNFFTKTINVAAAHPELDPFYLGYWDYSFAVHNNQSVTFQLPIRINNDIVGIMGIGVSTEYITEIISNLSTEVSNLFFVFGNNGEKIVASNVTDDDLKATGFSDFKSTQYNGLKELKLDTNNKYYFYSDSLNIYTQGTEYENEIWSIVGVISDSDLFGINDDIIWQIVFALVLCLFIGIAANIIISFFISRPIMRVSNELTYIEADKIKKTNITEVDVLINELQDYVKKSLELPTRLNRILDLVNLEIAGYEYDFDKRTVSVTDKFFKMLNMKSSTNVLAISDFEEIMNSIPKKNSYFDNNDEIFYLSESDKWIRLKNLKGDEYCSGIIQDITIEINERKQVEHERDYDALTGLLNRRGFLHEVTKAWNHDKYSLMAMIDLDNLKFINDKYGHDFGDDYINLVANDIKKLNSNKILTCHISGDEFLIYCYNFDTKAEIMDIMEAFNKRIRLQYIELYGERMYVRFSCGMAFNEDNLTNVEALRKRAEFTMYQIKSTIKNSYCYFDEKKFEENNYRLMSIEDFNTTINHHMVKYAFQPIIDIHAKTIIGYEALMRPIHETIKNPLKLLEIAKSINRLNDVESLTFFEATKAFFTYDSNKLLFINSLSSEIITERQLKQLKNMYKNKLEQLVIEITEEESQDEDIMKIKLNYVKDINANIAIDDYGTGYNNLAMILNYSSKYVKIEGSLIQGIDHDEKKYRLAKSIIDYCKNYKIKIIAESVETFEELKTVYDLGCDYVQGFLLHKPSFTLEELSESALEYLNKLNDNR